MEFSVGTITGVSTVAGSGIGQLVVRDEDGAVRVILCEAAPTLRALSAMGVMRSDASLRVRFARGARVRLAIDDLGVLASLQPEDEAPAGDENCAITSERR